MEGRHGTIKPRSRESKKVPETVNICRLIYRKLGVNVPYLILSLLGGELGS